MAAYSVADKILHRLALQSGLIAELSFDLDQKICGGASEPTAHTKHVFISGLARAGTTALMRAFYASGAFRSLTYRDMPFVLAPNLWRQLTQVSSRQAALAERAHADGILVDADSPESLDEVFWKQFARDDYIGKTHLRPHTPDPELCRKYVCYVDAILKAHNGKARRYLSKNNNNILRLGAIRGAFPKALILIPFRDPVSHAHSLLRQHHSFTKMQTEDNFVRTYMSWLGHYEFGLDHRPFHFGPGEVSSEHNTDRLEYWLDLWAGVYAWLESSAPDDAIWVCYEDLCARPGVWQTLARLAELREEALHAPFQAARTIRVSVQDKNLSEQASVLYESLVQKARACIDGSQTPDPKAG